MNASPVGHQMIVTNIMGFLWRFKAERGAWLVSDPWYGHQASGIKKELAATGRHGSGEPAHWPPSV
jgi:hypothetical protein